MQAKTKTRNIQVYLFIICLHANYFAENKSNIIIWACEFITLVLNNSLVLNIIEWQL